MLGDGVRAGPVGRPAVPGVCALPCASAPPWARGARLCRPRGGSVRRGRAEGPLRWLVSSRICSSRWWRPHVAAHGESHERLALPVCSPPVVRGDADHSLPTRPSAARGPHACALCGACVQLWSLVAGTWPRRANVGGRARRIAAPTWGARPSAPLQPGPRAAVPRVLVRVCPGSVASHEPAAWGVGEQLGPGSACPAP